MLVASVDRGAWREGRERETASVVAGRTSLAGLRWQVFAGEAGCEFSRRNVARLAAWLPGPLPRRPHEPRGKGRVRPAPSLRGESAPEPPPRLLQRLQLQLPLAVGDPSSGGRTSTDLHSSFRSMAPSPRRIGRHRHRLQRAGRRLPARRHHGNHLTGRPAFQVRHRLRWRGHQTVPPPIGTLLPALLGQFNPRRCQRGAPWPSHRNAVAAGTYWSVGCSAATDRDSCAPCPAATSSPEPRTSSYPSPETQEISPSRFSVDLVGRFPASPTISVLTSTGIRTGR